MFNRVAMGVACVVSLFLFVRTSLRYPDRPRVAPVLADYVDHKVVGDWHRLGWWGFADQGRYIDAALDWAHGNLDPAHHWYLPFYPLLGAIFVRLTPIQPFFIPDLLCFMSSLVLFAFLAERLWPETRYARGAGALVFTVCCGLQPRALTAWVVPWTSTPEATLFIASLLSVAIFLSRPRASAAFVAMLCASAVAGFRPADAACALSVDGCTMIAALVSARVDRRKWLSCGAAVMAGTALPLLAVLAAHLAVYGWTLGGYIRDSGQIGFEWRLLVQRWITIMVDPRPLFPEGQGLSSRFWWIMPGLAGMAVSLTARNTETRLLHPCVVTLLALDIAMLLAYRDLHPAGLWRYDNHHYFKWTLPFFGLYAIRLMMALAARRTAWLAAVSPVAVFASLFMWRIQLEGKTPLPPIMRLPDGRLSLILPDGAPRLGQDILAPVGGPWKDVYFGRHALLTDGTTYDSDSSFKIVPRDGGALIVPLRDMGHAPATIELDAGAVADGSWPPVLMDEHVVWGLPCWFPLMVCRPDSSDEP